jgi:hypothetical protein
MAQIPAPSPRRPLPASLGVLGARDAYLAQNGFDTASYTAPTFEVEAFGVTRTLRNSKDRMWAIPIHDLHHAVTGYGTDLVGEAEIGAFELVGGCRRPVTYALNGVAVLIGLAAAPVRTLRAFARARGTRTLYRANADYEALLSMSLGELRARLGVPEAGLADEPARLHDVAEAKLADAMPSAPRLGGVALASALVVGAAALGLGVAALVEGWGVRLVAVAVAVAGLALLKSALFARKGSLGARALAGYLGAALAAGAVLAPFAAR